MMGLKSKEPLTSSLIGEKKEIERRVDITTFIESLFLMALFFGFFTLTGLIGVILTKNALVFLAIGFGGTIVTGLVIIKRYVARA